MRTLVEGETGFLVGALTAVLSAVIVLGSFFLAFAEGDELAALRPSQTPTLTPIPTQTSVPVTPKPGEPTFTPSPIPTITPTLTPTITPTPICKNIPADWIAYEVQDGDKWKKLAGLYGITIGKIQDANCLLSTGMPYGLDIYLPPATVTPAFTATTTRTPTPTCIPYRPAGWVNYSVRPGDTLSSIAGAHNISPAGIQKPNCIIHANLIYIGQVIFVPPIAQSSTPQPSATPQPTLTPQPSATNTLPAPTATATTPPNTPLPSATHTSTSPPLSPTPTPSETAAPTTAAPTTAVPTTVVPTNVPTGTFTPTSPSTPTITSTVADSLPPTPTP